MELPPKSRRGVYYDLEVSPYAFTSPYGDVFKFASRKKLEMYRRDIQTEVQRVEKVLDKTGLAHTLPAEIINLIRRATYQAHYCKFER